MPISLLRTYVRSIHSQWHGVARRHLNHLDYLDRIDRGLSSWSRSDSNVGAAARKTHVLHEQRHDGVGLGVPHKGRTKSLKSSGHTGRADLTDDFRLSFLRNGSVPTQRFRRSRDASRKFPPSEGLTILLDLINRFYLCGNRCCSTRRSSRSFYPFFTLFSDHVRSERFSQRSGLISLGRLLRKWLWC